MICLLLLDEVLKNAKPHLISSKYNFMCTGVLLI